MFIHSYFIAQQFVALFKSITLCLRLFSDDREFFLRTELRSERLVLLAHLLNDVVTELQLLLKLRAWIHVLTLNVKLDCFDPRWRVRLNSCAIEIRALHVS